LKQNYDEVLRIADEVPSPGSLTETLRTVGGYTDYSAIDMTDGQFRETMKICCYIRNRFTMLRLMCDFELFDFDTELEF